MNIETPAESQVVLLLDDDPAVTEGLSMGLEQWGRTIVTCNDLESAQIMLERMRPSHVVSDVRLTGAFAFEGLDFVHYARQHSPETRIILMTGDASDAMQMEASQRGAVAFLQKPFGGVQLEALINVMSSDTPPSTIPPVLIEMPLLDDILAGDSLYTAFQPIVELGEVWQIFAFEALSRCRTSSPFANPSLLFEYAARKKRVCDLELACISRSLQSAAQLVKQERLFVNIHPDVFSAGSRLYDLLARCEPGLLSRLVLEVTEQAALSGSEAVFAMVEKIRSLGVRFAFDDLGIAYSHLIYIDRIRPSFLKVSQDFGTNFEVSDTKVKIITNFVSLAKDFGCDLILEGIEDPSTAEAGAQLGVRLGQGYLFGRPTEASAFSRHDRE